MQIFSLLNGQREREQTNELLLLLLLVLKVMQVDEMSLSFFVVGSVGVKELVKDCALNCL